MADSTTTVSGVAERYALALFDLARETGQLEPVAAGLSSFDELLAKSADFKRLIESPVFSADEQLGAVTAVMAKAGVDGVVANFVKVVARNRRLFALPGMIRGFREMLARQRGEVTAQVTSAEPLSETHLAALREALRSTLGKDVALETKVDPALIGGLVVQVGSRMVDTSLRTKLNAMKFAMKEVG